MSLGRKCEDIASDVRISRLEGNKLFPTFRTICLPLDKLL
jgi:hypothetical protein